MAAPSIAGSIAGSTLLPDRWDVTPQIDIYLNYLKARCETEKKEDPLYKLALKIINQEGISLEEVAPLASRATLKVETGISLLDERVGSLSLTHLAAIKGNIELTDCLYRLGVLDHSGIAGRITPCHLAALKGHVSYLQKALSWGCRLDEPTLTGFTAVDIFETVYPDRAKACPSNTLPKTIKVITSEKAVVDMPLTEAEERYHFIFTDRICTNAATMERKLAGEGEKPPFRRSSSLPSLAVARIKDLKPELALDIGLGVVATEVIPKGTNIGPYSGIHYLNNKSSVHQLGVKEPVFTEEGEMKDTEASIDGEYFRNLIPLMADGFPNVKIDRVYQREPKSGGVTYSDDYISCLVALRDILPGELVLWSYGLGHPITFGPYIHLAEEALNEFIRDLPSIISAVRAHPISRDVLSPLGSTSELELPIEQLSYFFDRPKIFLEHILLGHVDLALFDEEFLKRISYFSNIHPIVKCLNIWFLAANTPEKRKILWEHLQKIGAEDFKKAFLFFEEKNAGLSSDVREKSAEEFRAYLDSL